MPEPADSQDDREPTGRHDRHDPNGHTHSQEHGHGHSHAGHSHNHSHAPDIKNASNALKMRFYTGIALNIVFVVIEVVYGFLYNSMALLADAGHNLSDVVGLILALIAVYFGDMKATNRFTYGFGRVTILVSLINAVLILFAAGGLGWETLNRLKDTPDVPGLAIMLVAAIGFVINTATSLLFVKGREDLNVRGALLHMVADALVSLGVVAGGAVILYTGWSWVDPVLSLLIVAVIVISTIDLLKESLRLSLDAAPSHVPMDKVRDYFLSKQETVSYHDLHVWPISTTSTALSVHLRVHDQYFGAPHADKMLRKIQSDMNEKFGIDHATVQLESSAFDCERPGQCDHGNES